MSWSDDPTPTSNTATPTGTTTATPTGTTSATQEPPNSRPTSQTAPPPLRRRRSKSQEKSRSAATESVDSTRETEKEESKTATDAKGSEGTKDSDVEEAIPIPSKVESDSIPGVGGVEVSAVTASGDNKPGDSEQPTQPVTVDQSPDPSSTLPVETDKREMVEAHSDPIPGDASTTDANKPSDDGDRESNKKLEQASEGEETIHEG